MQRISIAVLSLFAALALSAGCAQHGTHSDAAPHSSTRAHPDSHATGHAAGHAQDHSFEGAEQWAARFDSPTRDAWQRPNAVLDRLQLQDGMQVADIGSGTGYFAVRLARAVPTGSVYGIDTEPDMVRYLNERATREGLANLESSLGLPEDPQLPETVDLVLVVDTYHHISDRRAYFEHVAHGLAPGARVAIVDFKMGDLPVGPPDAMKIPADQIIQEMQAAGYAIETDDRTLLPHQVLLIFTAPAPVPAP